VRVILSIYDPFEAACVVVVVSFDPAPKNEVPAYFLKMDTCRLETSAVVVVGPVSCGFLVSVSMEVFI